MRNIPIPKNALLDHLIDHLNLKNNRALAQHLGVTQSALSKIRYGTNKPSADFILLIYDKTDLSIEEIRAKIAEQEKLNGSDA
jgi:transcriptional regulator with XRE-family HTH domain